MSIESAMQEHLDNLIKPIGSLGDLETFALKLADIQQCVPPVIEKKAVYVFAADHGITDEGVSLYPKEVTHQMVLNFLGNGAAINVLAKHNGFDIFVVDAGILQAVDDGRVIDCRAGSGTNNFLEEPAMSEAQLETCLSNGSRLAEQAAQNGYQLVAVGDMGIGNTTAAAAMLIASGLDASNIVDRGTGINDEALANKRRIIESAVKKHEPYNSPAAILSSVGGFELCTMVGFILGLKDRKIACVIDGFPVGSAAYMAYMMDPTITSFLFAGHLSKVKGHATVLSKMQLTPVLDLKMRLGEGTGAVLGGQLVCLAACVAAEMASFKSANVSRSEGVEENY